MAHLDRSDLGAWLILTGVTWDIADLEKTWGMAVLDRVAWCVAYQNTEGLGAAKIDSLIC